jgi:hypothetical protein
MKEFEFEVLVSHVQDANEAHVKDPFEPTEEEQELSVEVASVSYWM